LIRQGGTMTTREGFRALAIALTPLAWLARASM
jgi:hypothetical protein